MKKYTISTKAVAELFVVVAITAICAHTFYLAPKLREARKQILEQTQLSAIPFEPEQDAKEELEFIQFKGSSTQYIPPPHVTHKSKGYYVILSQAPNMPKLVLCESTPTEKNYDKNPAKSAIMKVNQECFEAQMIGPPPSDLTPAVNLYKNAVLMRWLNTYNR